MTEQDTFDRLRRVSFEQMKEIKGRWIVDNDDTRSFEEVLASVGWNRLLWAEEQNTLVINTRSN